MSLREVCAMAVLAAALGWLLKAAGAKHANTVSLAAGLFLSLFAVSRYREPVRAMLEMAGQAGVSASVTAILKMMAVGCLSTVAADICRDMGESTMGARIELCGRAEIMLLCLPFLLELFSVALEVVS